MQDQARLYRRLFGRFATGVAVVLAEENGEMSGLTVNSLTSASLDPLLLLFCTRKESRSAAAILGAGRFSVNVLSARQRNIANYFAGQREEHVNLGLQRENGFVWFAGSNAVFFCEREAVHPGGDHQIILGRVVDLRGPEGCDQMLLYHEGQYAVLNPRAQAIPMEIELP